MDGKISTYPFLVSEVGKVFVVNQNGTLTESEQNLCYWTSSSTKRLIYLFSRYREKVGSSKVRTLKQMWTIIAEELSKELNMKITANNAENRMRVLERNYKKYIENKATGQVRRFFEFANEMDEIPKWVFFEKRSSKVPQVSEEVQIPKVQCSLVYSDEETTLHTTKDPSSDIYQNKKKQILKQKMREMERMRLNKLEYQREKLKLLEKIANDKNNLIRERNEILKQRNEILKNLKCLCTKEKM